MKGLLFIFAIYTATLFGQTYSNPETTVPPTMSEMILNGKYIKLSDNSTWEIYPPDIPIAQGWIAAVPINISKSKNPQYPFLLTNTVTNSSVRAQKVNLAPMYPTDKDLTPKQYHKSPKKSSSSSDY